MFRDSGGSLTRQSSQDNGPDGPYLSTTNKLEQVESTRSQQSTAVHFICLLDNEGPEQMFHF